MQWFNIINRERQGNIVQLHNTVVGKVTWLLQWSKFFTNGKYKWTPRNKVVRWVCSTYHWICFLEQPERIVKQQDIAHKGVHIPRITVLAWILVTFFGLATHVRLCLENTSIWHSFYVVAHLFHGSLYLHGSHQFWPAFFKARLDHSVQWAFKFVQKHGTGVRRRKICKIFLLYSVPACSRGHVR